VTLGTSVSGSTCDGTATPSENPCEVGNNPEVEVVVDGTNGAAFQLSVSGGYSIMGYFACDSVSSTQCMFGGGGAGTFQPDPRMTIFGISRADAACGSFTLSASAL